MNTLDCQSVSFRYRAGGPWILENFTHAFGPGFSLVQGASGCGKSTLLRLLAGYLVPNSGTVITPQGGAPTEPSFQRRQLGYVFQQINLLPLASLSRNLELAASLAGVSEAAFREQTARWLGLLGLETLAGRRPESLSGGQQQRAAIARALVREPRVLLLDEPTSGLDDLNTEVIARALVRFVRSGSAEPAGRICVICSHDRRLLSIADEILDFNCLIPLERHLVALAGTAQ